MSYEAEATPDKAPRTGRREAAVAALAGVAVVVVWEIICRIGLVSKLVLPAPSAIGIALWASVREIATGGPMRGNMLTTIYEILAGFGVGVALGFVLGVLIAEIASIRRVAMPYLIALNAAPKIALAPLLLVWFGFGMGSKIVMAALIAFFPLLINVITGLSSVEEAKLKLMRSLAASRAMTLVKVKLPDAMPMIFAGLKTAIVLAVVGAVVGEFVGAESGLGHVIKQSEFQLDVSQTFAVIVLLSIIGIAFFYAIEYLERRALFWTRPPR
ncbi:MAG TPA: ABC transporter permease [Casimicrobiaceae bacterium]|nr:ABC transporter permease [Casimicrobiaceae bacterium]